MSLYPEYTLVQKCLQLIEAKLQWGNAKNWHNDVFTELSDKINEDTSVLLSITTLKRVWGKVKYNSAPSITTLNTLAQFAGFNNWRDFKNKHDKKESWFEKNINPNSHVIIISAIVLALGFVSIYSMFSVSETTPNHDLSNVKFSSEPITRGLPNSVIFNFDLNDIKSDSIYIQQFWDVTKTIKIASHEKQATGIYYYPGYFRSKLLVDAELIREHDLFIKSNGWMGTLDYEPVPKYVLKEDIMTDKMTFSKTILDEISNNEKPLQSSFHFINDFANVSGDHIRIVQSLQSILDDKWAVCQNLKIVILGSEGAIIIPFSKLGCVSNIGLMMNDVYLSGKKHDLSMFGVDLNETRDIDITIKSKNISVTVDSTIIYEGQYNKSIGRFVGLRYRFLGAGAINSFEIIDLKRHTSILNSNF